MPLFDYQDFQTERNIALSSPEGQTIAKSLISAVTAWASAIVGYDLEGSTRTAFFEEGARRMYLPTTAPVSNVVISTVAR